MDLASLNDIGITVCAVLGLAIFWWAGRSEEKRIEKKSDAGRKEDQHG